MGSSSSSSSPSSASAGGGAAAGAPSPADSASARTLDRRRAMDARFTWSVLPRAVARWSVTVEMPLRSSM